MRREHTYPVSPRRLLEILTDDAFLRARAERFGGDGEPRVQRSDTQIVVVTVRQLPLDAVPGALRSFVGSGRVKQTDTWDGIAEDRVHGTWHTETGPAPIDLGGSHDITGTAAQSVYAVTANVKVSIPIVGGKIAKQVEDYLRTLIGKEHEFAAEWVARHA